MPDVAVFVRGNSDILASTAPLLYSVSGVSVRELWNVVVSD
jgi:hypothetical protein